MAHRLLANENIPISLIERLRSSGQDVVWIKESKPGSADDEIFSIAESDDRIILTQDKDFGALAFLRDLPNPPGVILLRFASSSPEDFSRTALTMILSRQDWIGNFSVISEGRIRMRTLRSES